jgi:tellurite resistance protein
MKRLTLSPEACVETLTLLIAIAHADGVLDPKEQEGVRAAAAVFNLTRELRERIEHLLSAPIPVGQLLVEQLSAKERAFAFVAASWMTGLDATVDPKETAMLDEVAVLFGFDAARCAKLSTLARELEPVRSPDTRWSGELKALFKAIPGHVEGDKNIEIVFDGPGLFWH